MEANTHRPMWKKTLLAFAIIIYFVWGSTYLAIRVGVREVPPFLFSSGGDMRFFRSRDMLHFWLDALARGERYNGLARGSTE